MRAGSFGPRRRRSIPGGYLVGGMLVLLLAALYVFGSDEEPTTTATPTTQPDTPGPGGGEAASGGDGEASEGGGSGGERRSTRRRSRTVRLQIIPTGEVYVCLVDRTGRVLVNGATLRPGDRTDTFRSRRFRLVLGNNNVRLRINGTNRAVPASDQPIFYDITRARGRQPLAAGSRPSCA